MSRLLWILLIAAGITWAQAQPRQIVVVVATDADCCASCPADASAQATASVMDCLICIACLPAASYLPPESNPTVSPPRLIEALELTDNRGMSRAEPPLLTPPRRAGFAIENNLYSST